MFLLNGKPVHCVNDTPHTSWLLKNGAKLVTKFDTIKNPKRYKDAIFVIRGIKHRKIIQSLIENEIDYYYIDTGYFGNDIRKVWHRVVPNSLHHHKLIQRPSDRLDLILKYISDNYNYGKKDVIKKWKKTGNNILLCPPSAKSMKFYKKDLKTWTKETISTLEKYTDRSIVLREKPPSRTIRINTNTMSDALNNDIFALVTYNSIAAVEAVMHGIPAFTLCENAAMPVSCATLKRINKPFYPSLEERWNWLNNLSYGQFSMNELTEGDAWRIINEDRRA